jgi:hypothetical protein
MSGGSSKNEGVILLAEFAERVIPLSGEPASKDPLRAASRSTNEGIDLLGEFRDRTESVPEPARVPSSEQPSEKGETARAVSSCFIELVIDTSFESFGDEEQTRFLRSLGQLLGIGGAIDVKEKKPGSVKLTIELSREQADKLLEALREGTLQELNIIAGTIVGCSPQPGSRALEPPRSTNPSAPGHTADEAK